MTTVMEINREQWPHYFSEKENYESENDQSGESDFEMVDEEEEATAIARADLMMLKLNKHGLVEGVDPNDDDALRGVLPEVFTCVANDEVHFDQRNIDPFNEAYDAMLKPMINNDIHEKRYIAPIDVCKRKCEDSCKCPRVKSGVIINGTWYAEDYRVMYPRQIKELMNDIISQVELMKEPIVTPEHVPFSERNVLNEDDHKIIDDAVQECMNNEGFGDDEFSDDELSEDESELDEEDAKELLRLIVTSPEKIVDEAVIAQMKEFEEDREEEILIFRAAQRIQALARRYLARIHTVEYDKMFESDDSMDYCSHLVYEGEDPGREDIVRCDYCAATKKYSKMWNTCDERDTSVPLEFYVCDEYCYNQHISNLGQDLSNLSLSEKESDAEGKKEEEVQQTIPMYSGLAVGDNNNEKPLIQQAQEQVGRERNEEMNASLDYDSRTDDDDMAAHNDDGDFEEEPRAKKEALPVVNRKRKRKPKYNVRMQNVKDNDLRNVNETITAERFNAIMNHGFCPYKGCNHHEDHRDKKETRRPNMRKHLIGIHNCTILDEYGNAFNIYKFKCNHPKCVEKQNTWVTKGALAFSEYRGHMQTHCRTVTKVDGGGALAACGKVTYPFQYNNCPLNCSCWKQHLGDGCKDGCLKCKKRRRVDALKI